jgi:hypothetical protein
VPLAVALVANVAEVVVIEVTTVLVEAAEALVRADDVAVVRPVTAEPVVVLTPVAKFELELVKPVIADAVPDILTPVAKVEEPVVIEPTAVAVEPAVAVLANAAVEDVREVIAFVVPEADTDVNASPKIRVVPDTLATFADELVIPVTQDLVAPAETEVTALPVV